MAVRLRKVGRVRFHFQVTNTLTDITLAKQKQRLPAGLPAPSAEAEVHSEQLCDRIRAEMDAVGGAIPFARFMDLALYAPGLGYYSAGSRKFGADGDFVTAPEISSLFSHCIARQCAEILEELGGGSIMEFGAGSGIMAADLLKALETSAHLPDSYCIVELSAELQARQRETLALRVPHLVERVRWLDALPQSFRGIVLANELIDAMPVHRFQLTQEGFVEAYVCSNDDTFTWLPQPLGEGELLAAVETARADLEGSPWALGYTSEINLAGAAWVRSLGDVLERGAALIIDYGFPRREFYHPDRRRGTLVCHYRHRVHDDPLILVGLQDITAHVDFTALADAALESGFSVAGYTTQAHFLLGCGLLQLTERFSADDERRRLPLAQQVKRLTLPNEMGELFKAIALTKNVERPLTGFSLLDQRWRL